MKHLSFTILFLLLIGCSTPPEQILVKEHTYVVRTASQALKAIPPLPKPIDPKTANQLDLATWIVASEARALRLEAIIKNLIDFYEAPLETK